MLYAESGLRATLRFYAVDALSGVVKKNAVYVMGGLQEIHLWRAIDTGEFVQNVVKDREIGEKFIGVKEIRTLMSSFKRIKRDKI